MPGLIQAVFFDVDGVLIDSLPQHLQICRDKAREFRLRLEIPDLNGMRRLISDGVKVSPMIEFFRAVGFPEKYAAKAVTDYEREFMQRYHPTLFYGVEAMLRTLHQAGQRLGLVTSNTRANVAPVLTDVMQYFDPSCTFFYDEYQFEMTKSECLAEGSRRLELPASRCTYVGDQPADAVAARKAGTRFLGVTYGWGLLGSGPDMDMARSVSEIPAKLLEVYAST